MAQPDYFNSLTSWNQPYTGGGFNLGVPKTQPTFSIPSADPNAGSSYGFGASQDLTGGAEGSVGGFEKFMTGMIGTKEAPGWGGQAAGLASGLFNGWLGMQQYGLAKKTLEQNKQQFDLNYAAQKTTTNANLEDRQRARVAANPGAYQSVGSYMNQNGIK